MKHRTKTQLLAGAACCLATTGTAQARDARGVFYDVPGFVIPDNSPEGASSSVEAGPIDAVAGMRITLRFPMTAGTGGHAWCGDLIATLSFTPDDGGATRSLDLFNRIGADSAFSRGDGSDFLGNYNLFASASNPPIWDAAALVDDFERIPGNDYRPSTRSAAFQYQQTSFFQTFGNFTPAGTWTLNISDHAAGATGRLLGWSIYPFIPAPCSAAALLLPGAMLLRRRRS